MTVLDAGLIAVIIFFVAWGAWIGLLGQLALVIALLASFAVAGAYAGELQGLAAPLAASPRLAFLLTYLLLLAATYLVVRLLAIGLRLVINISLTSWFDRLLGGAFGLAKAYLLLVLFYLALSSFSTTLHPMLQQSFFSPYLEAGARCLQSWVRNEQVRELFLPPEPAIPAAMPIPGSPPPGGSVPAAERSR